jgi:hypothetical protein
MLYAGHERCLPAYDAGGVPRLENQQELKHEFDGFQPAAMTGLSAAHSRIQVNLLGLLFNALRSDRCQPHGSDLKVQVAGRNS